MPTLKHLLDELHKLSVDPDDISMPGQLYDDFVDQAAEVIDNPEDNPEER